MEGLSVLREGLNGGSDADGGKAGGRGSGCRTFGSPSKHCQARACSSTSRGVNSLSLGICEVFSQSKPPCYLKNGRSAHGDDDCADGKMVWSELSL